MRVYCGGRRFSLFCHLTADGGINTRLTNMIEIRRVLHEDWFTLVQNWTHQETIVAVVVAVALIGIAVLVVRK